ncbi:MAG TPA: tetratricopeptide repeat protein [Candidatus Limnocylindria bacterium]|nr:tetratricopeptide repeat protein [Candidatus Limnocylindria bacterium]
MSDLQEQFDDATVDFATHAYAEALVKYQAILAEQPDHFDAQQGVAMCYYRLGDYPTAIVEGHKAEAMRPNDQTVHTNLSLYYQKAGDKTTAEKYGLKAKIASWKENMAAPGSTPAGADDDSELKMAQAKPSSFKMPEKFPDMPWKKTKPVTTPKTPPPPSGH